MRRPGLNAEIAFFRWSVEGREGLGTYEVARPDAEIEAIVCDFGGVLTTPLLTSFMAVQDEIGISPENLGRAMKAITEEDGENPLYALERGEMAEVDFLARLGDGLEPLLGHRPELHRFRETYFEALHPNPPMIELMRELRPPASGWRC